MPLNAIKCFKKKSKIPNTVDRCATRHDFYTSKLPIDVLVRRMRMVLIFFPKLIFKFNKSSEKTIFQSLTTLRFNNKNYLKLFSFVCYQFAH